MSEDVASSTAPTDERSRAADGRARSTSDTSSGLVPERDRGDGGSLWLAAPLWTLTAVFLAVALIRSAAVDIPLRDPHGLLFWGRIPRAIGMGLGVAVVDVLVRTALLGRARWRWSSLVAMTRARWPWRRTVLVLTGVVAYYTVYVSYRNLKSWDVLNTPKDSSMLSIDKAIFFGHHPATVLHSLFGTNHAAVFFSGIYQSFTYLVVITVVGALFLIADVRRAYVFLGAACWAWIIGTISYYLVPTLGPFASAPQEFAHLRHTHINGEWAGDLAGRENVLHDPGNPHSFAGISAFASLHTGFTCMVLVMAVYYGWKRTSWVLGLYLVLIVLSTIYFGWHFILDDVAGVALALASVWLGSRMVYARSGGREPARESAGEPAP